jgi:hypothetical protein
MSLRSWSSSRSKAWMVKGVDVETLTPKIIDNSIVEKIAKEGFIEKVFGKSLR